MLPIDWIIICLFIIGSILGALLGLLFIQIPSACYGG